MSAPMIAWAPALYNTYRYLTTWNSRSSKAINLPSVEIHDIETAPEKRPRTLKHLIKANHVNHSILYHNLQFHNHMPHILGSAYLMGATADQLHEIYDKDSKELDGWKDSPSEITSNDWQEYLGQKEYQRAYVDFFEDELALKFGYQWKTVVGEYLYAGTSPLINNLIAGLGHPLIHLGYAFELQNRELAIEALSLAATNRNFMHKYLDDPSYTKASPFSSTSILELLHKTAKDTRFDGLFETQGEENIQPLLDNREELVMEYWNAWDLKNPLKQFQESQEAAVAVFVASVPVGTHAYSFFLVHLLTTSHAVRILLSFIEQKYHMSLVRQWWLLTISVYISQLRPKIDEELIGRPDLGGKHWKYVEDKALNGPWAKDAHYVKALRAMREAAQTWGDVHEWYLTAAIRFADDFDGWVF